MRIGIIGLGVVGSAINTGFDMLGHDMLVHDPKLKTKLKVFYELKLYFCAYRLHKAMTGVVIPQ